MSSIPKPSRIARPMTTSQTSEKGKPPGADSGNPKNLNVGDNVLVRDTTHGVIAFLGETTFSTGLWAGVILDKPEGRNDGSVDGVSYFKCKAMHGIFSRPSRLTLRDALENARNGPIPNINFPHNSRLGSKEKSPHQGLSSLLSKASSPNKVVSPPHYEDGYRRTPSPTGSMTSISSFRASEALQIGDRVIISSSTTGSKVGTLRYVGKAEFATGEWAGVELDLPNGKNNGSVQGTTYFDCKPNHGVFVLSSKVTKSPRNFMHGRQLSNLSTMSTVTPARKMCRQKSDVSSASISSTSANKRRSISSINAPEMLKLSLKEKEAEIDKLTKEMELERAHFSKAASQTDIVDAKLKDMEKEFGKYKLQSISSVQTKDSQISELTSKLSEEKQKFEDLQFQFEELQLSKSSSDQNDSSLKGKIEESNKLIKELQSERAELKKYHSDSLIQIKDLEEKYSDLAFESEEKLVTLNSEVDELKKNNEKMASSLEREKERSVSIQDKIKMEEEAVVRKIETLEEYVSHKDEEILELTMKIESYEKSEDSTSEKYENILSDLKDSQFKNQELNTKFSKIEVELKCQCGEVDRLNNKITNLNECVENKDSEIKTMKKNIASIEKSLKSKEEEVEQVTVKFTESDSSTHKELQKLSSENKALHEKLESVSSSSNKDMKEIEEKLTSAELEKTEAQKKMESLSDANVNLEKEIEMLRSGSNINNEEVKRLSGCLSLKDSEMSALRADLSNLVSQLNTLKDVITQNEFEAKEKELLLIKEHEKEMQKLTEALKKSEGIVKKVEKAKNEVMELCNDKIKCIRTETADQEAALKKELVEALAENTRLADSLELTKAQIAQTGTDQSEELSHLKEAIETNIKNTRFKEEELEGLQKELSETNLKLNLAAEESNKERKQKIQLQERLESLKQTHDEEMGELVDVVNDLKEKDDELKVAMNELEGKTDALVKLEREAERKEKSLQEEIERLKASNKEETSVLSSSLEEAKGQITYLKESSASSKVDYDLRKGKLDKEKESLEESHLKELDKKEDLIQKLKSEVANKEVELEVANDELKAKTEELEQVSLDLEVKDASYSNRVKINDESHKSEVEVLVSKVEDAKAEVIDLNEKLAKTRAEHDSKLDELKLEKKTEVNHLQDLLSERDRDIVDLKASIHELGNQVKDVSRSSGDEVKLLNAKISKLLSESEDLRSNRKDVESRLKIMETQYEEMSVRNEELNSLMIEKETQIKESTSHAQSVKLSYEKTKKELAEHVEKTIEMSSGNDELHSTLNRERMRVDELQVALGEIESERDGLRKQLEGYSASKKKLKTLTATELELKSVIEDMRRQKTVMENEFRDEKQELNEVVQNSQVLLREKIEEFKSQKREFESLQSENAQVNSYKRKMLILEQEKRELESKLNNSGANGLNNNEQYDRGKKTVEEVDEEGLEGLRSQVDFLNSVIVDMQRKNDKYKMKLELYESGKVVGGSDDPNDEHSQLNLLLNGIDSHQVPPRLFCDICDQFDLHDTEDCPTQSNMVVDEAAHTRNEAPRTSSRPYCESCEVFGHDTQDCNEEETY